MLCLLLDGLVSLPAIVVLVAIVVLLLRWVGLVWLGTVIVPSPSSLCVLGETCDGNTRDN